MSQRIITGIDIGTHTVKVVIAQMRDAAPPMILGTGQSYTHGLKNGYVTNTKDVFRSVKQAVDKAQKMANIGIENAYLGIGGIGISSIYSNAELVVSKVDNQIDDIDINKVIDRAKAKASKELVNREILHTIPLKYYVDKKEVLGEPLGLKGGKLSADILLVTVLQPHLQALKESVEALDIDVLDVLASPIAASLVVLSREQKEAGCVLANIGAETVSVVVFEDGSPISLQVFPVGSSDITSDIALKLQVPLSQAEELKRGSLTDVSIPQKRLEEIIEHRLKEMFLIIQGHLKEIGKNELLPAGVILTGGGVGLAQVRDLARVALRLPSELANLKVPGSTVKDSTWAVAYGLCIYGNGKIMEKSRKSPVKIKNFLHNIIKHFIP